MKSKFRVGFALGALCIAASQAFAGVKLDEAVVGKVIDEGPIELGFWSGPPVPLPAGKWLVRYRDESKLGFGPVYRNVKFTRLTLENVSGAGNVPAFISDFNTETGNFSESGNRCTDEIAKKSGGYFNDFGYSKTSLYSLCVMIAPTTDSGNFYTGTGKYRDYRVDGQLVQSFLTVRAFAFKERGRIVDMKFPVAITSSVVTLADFIPGSPLYKDAQAFAEEFGKRLYANIVDGKSVTIPDFQISK